MKFSVGSFCKIVGRSTYKGGCLKDTYCVVCKIGEDYLGVYPLDGRMNAASLDGTYWPPNKDIITCGVESALRETICKGIMLGVSYNDAWNQLSDILEKFVAKGILMDAVMSTLDSITEDRVKNESSYYFDTAKTLPINTNNINTQLGGNDMNKFENLINKVCDDDRRFIRENQQANGKQLIDNDPRMITLFEQFPTLSVSKKQTLREYICGALDKEDLMMQQLKQIDVDTQSKENQLRDFYLEVQANIISVDNYEQGVKLLQNYGILDSDGIVAPFANRKFNKEDK